MLRLKAFKPSTEKIVKIQLHPAHPWMVTADASDRVCVWNWEHHQVIYELKAGGVDERRLVGVKLDKLAEGETAKGRPTEAIKGGGVKQVSFFDDDVSFWQHWRNRFTAAEVPSSVNHVASPFSSSVPSTKGRHFLVICCENKATFLDLVTMRGHDVPKQELDNKSLLCMEFLSRPTVGDGPLVAFGGSDGMIRVLSMMTWKLAGRYAGGHKGAITCLMTFMAISGEALLVSGASDGVLVIWGAGQGQASRELIPKISLKAHDGGVVTLELSRVIGNAPQLITIGADKILAIWDTVSFKELRRIKPVPKLACNSVASWCHPRAPNLDILTCVKDSHIWAIENPTYSAITRPLCDLSSLIPPQILAQTKKLKVYCMAVHPLQPHLVATGTNTGVIVSEFDARSLPPATALPTPPESREHSAVFVVERGLKLLQFELSKTVNPSFGSNSSLTETERSEGHMFEPLAVKQVKKHKSIALPHDSYSVLSVSSSGKYVAIVWPDIPYFSVYKAKDWSVVDSGSARLLAWDTCRDRFAILESASTPRIPVIPKGFSSRKAREAAAAAQATAAAASAASAGSVQVRILLDDGTSNILMRSIGGRSEPVTGLHGGALLGVAYRTYRRVSPATQSMPLSGYGGSALSSFSTLEDGFASTKSPSEAAPHNFQLYSWETFEPLGSLLPQPDWTAWDQTVEYCAFAYQQYIVISSLRPQYRYLGDVAISYATNGVWQRRQLFVATPTTVEIVFVDAGVAPLDIKTKKLKEESKMQEVQAGALIHQGELALLTVEGPQADTKGNMSLRPPMLQVVRLASFQHAPSIPPFLTDTKHSTYGEYPGLVREMEERKIDEVAVGGGGVSVSVSRFPAEQKRPIGPLVVVGVRDGVLWLIDRYMCAHAISLSHPGIRCRCLVAYGDAVSAVKWAIRLGREHHDDFAQFLLGMGYATEALHLPGISKRLEFDMAMKSNDLKRALQCLLTMSNSRGIGHHDNTVFNLNEILNATAKNENVIEAVKGIVKFAKEFLDLIDAADATAQGDIAREALKKLATAGSVKGALQGHQLRGLALRLANHGELTRLGGLINNLIPLGLGREASFAAALLGDSALMEKAWHDTGMLAEVVLHAQAHGRPNLKNLAQTWNRVLQSELEPTPSKKTDAAAAFLASLEEPKLTSLGEAGKKPPIEILPPGMITFSSLTPVQKKPPATTPSSQQQSSEPLMLEAPPSAGTLTTGTGTPATTAGDAITRTETPATTGEPEIETPASLGLEPETAPVIDTPQLESTSEAAQTPEARPYQSEPGETKEFSDGAPSSSLVDEADSIVPGDTNEPAPMSAPTPPDAQIPALQAPAVDTGIQRTVSPTMSLSDFLA